MFEAMDRIWNLDHKDMQELKMTQHELSEEQRQKEACEPITEEILQTICKQLSRDIWANIEMYNMSVLVKDMSEEIEKAFLQIVVNLIDAHFAKRHAGIEDEEGSTRSQSSEEI